MEANIDFLGNGSLCRTTRLLSSDQSTHILCIEKLLSENDCLQIIQSEKTLQNSDEIDINGTSAQSAYGYKGSFVDSTINQSIEQIVRRLLNHSIIHAIKFKVYEVGQSITQHNDISNYTLLIYLNDCEGGETVFPNFSDSDVSIKPVTGNAIMFSSIKKGLCKNVNNAFKQLAHFSNPATCKKFILQIQWNV
jgi:hypothetical protein